MPYCPGCDGCASLTETMLAEALAPCPAGSLAGPKWAGEQLSLSVDLVAAGRLHRVGYALALAETGFIRWTVRATSEARWLTIASACSCTALSRYGVIRHPRRADKEVNLDLLRPPLQLQGRAERAGPGWPPIWKRRAPSALAAGRRSFRPYGGRMGIVARRAPAAFLWPVGHVGAAALQCPGPTVRASRRNVSAGARTQEGPSLRRPILKPRKIAVKGALRARFARPWTANLGEDSSGAYRRDGGLGALTTATTDNPPL